MSDPFRYFNSSPEVIRLVVMMYVKYQLSLRNVEDLLAERGIDISHETVRFWWNRFGPMFAAEIRKKRVAHLRHFPQWRWHLDEVFVKVNGKFCHLWRAVDHEGEVLEAVVTAKRDKAAALKFLKRGLRRPFRGSVRLSRLDATASLWLQNSVSQIRAGWASRGICRGDIVNWVIRRLESPSAPTRHVPLRRVGSLQIGALQRDRAG
jgi:transposase-like protein